MLESLERECIRPEQFIICSGNVNEFYHSPSVRRPDLLLAKPVRTEDILAILGELVERKHQNSAAACNEFTMNTAESFQKIHDNKCSGCLESGAIKHNEKRKRVRFRPDPSHGAFIQFLLTEQLPSRFVPHCAALIVDFTSFGGAGLVLSKNIHIKKNSLCRVQIGPFDPIRAQIVYIHELDDAYIRMGCRFLE